MCPQTTRSLSSRGCQGPRPCLRGPSGFSPASSLADLLPTDLTRAPHALAPLRSTPGEPPPQRGRGPRIGDPVPPRSRSGAPAEQGRSAPHARASLFAHELRRRPPRRSCRCYLPPSTSMPRSPSRDASEHTTTSPYVLTPKPQRAPLHVVTGPATRSVRTRKGASLATGCPAQTGFAPTPRDGAGQDGARRQAHRGPAGPPPASLTAQHSLTCPD